MHDVSRLHRFVLLIAAVVGSVCTASAAASQQDGPVVLLPKHRLEAAELAVVVNDRDPLSQRIARYYQRRRGIPEANLIQIAFTPGRAQISPEEFADLKRQVDAEAPGGTQAYVLTWAAPYRVGCMSITSAFASGFDRAWCSRERCAPTKQSPYFNSDSASPFADFKVRPTIALAATDFAQAKELIDRGIAADGSRPKGTAYLVSTSDRARNVRAAMYPEMVTVFSPRVKTHVIEAEALRDRDDVLFYFTGRREVDGLDTLRFLPGALADHLTSTGGRLTDSRQMSALRWLEAGATGSYGTVVEPCNLPGKFPNPGLLMQHYLQGETLIEAYWKSVAMPGEGIFIGEPLAAPFDFLQVDREDEGIVVHTWSLKPGTYRLEAAPSVVGPFRAEGQLVQVGFPAQAFRIPDLGAAAYRLTPAGDALPR